MAVFSDTDLDGLVQRFEFWARLKNGSATGNLLKQITTRINVAYEKIMPLLLSNSDFIRFDDPNHTDRPIGTIDIVSGQNDYTIKQDANSLDILNFNAVRILTGASEDQYQEITKLKLDDPRVLDAMSPNSDSTGIPSFYVENGNNLFFSPTFDYSVTDGIKLYFQREFERFSDTGDDTKTSGIPKIFDELLVLHAVNDWIAVNRTNDVSLRNEVRAQINTMEGNLQKFIDLRNPTDLVMTMKPPRNFR